VTTSPAVYGVLAEFEIRPRSSRRRIARARRGLSPPWTRTRRPDRGTSRGHRRPPHAAAAHRADRRPDSAASAASRCSTGRRRSRIRSTSQASRSTAGRRSFRSRSSARFSSPRCPPCGHAGAERPAAAVSPGLQRARRFALASRNRFFLCLERETRSSMSRARGSFSRRWNPREVTTVSD